MAHIVVYLQRTTRGLHPGSLVGLCLARDIADDRGASVLGMCLGDAGAFDDRVVVEASRAGADQLVFLGPEGINKLFRRITPRHVFAPYTREAGSVLAQAGIGPMVGRWIDGPPEANRRIETVIGTVAGTLPWRHTPMQVEPEYEADVTQVELPEWLANAAAAATDLSATIEQPPIMYLSPKPLTAELETALGSVGAYPMAIDALDLSKLDEATLLWIDEAGEGLPLTLVERSPGVRVILLVGDKQISGPIDPSWGLADFVLTGPLAQTVREFSGQAWKLMFA
ncbi:MAG: hypothetical protein KC457_27100 [Myxococcales bacterium]|nr:hypothetical protein [Myxococcales bacterium]